MVMRKFIIIIIVPFLTLFTQVKAENECFEKASRAIFKFNMGSQLIMGPISQKVTINFQSPLKMVQAISHRILLLYYLYPIIYFKEILEEQEMLRLVSSSILQ